jgi:hypothetical protein
MTDRPESVLAMIQVAAGATEDTEYQITFRAWQLKEISKYIKTLEKESSNDRQDTDR